MNEQTNQPLTEICSLYDEIDCRSEEMEERLGRKDGGMNADILIRLSAIEDRADQLLLNQSVGKVVLVWIISPIPVFNYSTFKLGLNTI